MGGPDFEKLLKLGFLRFTSDTSGMADEPLAILAAMDYFSKAEWTMKHFLHEAILNDVPSSRGFAFEPFATYPVLLAFSKPKVLSEVFSFQGVYSSLWDMSAQLVAAHKVDGKFTFHSVDISSVKRPIYCLGQSCTTERETLSWLQDPDNTVVCFPASKVGPDAIFLLRLQDETILPVLVSFKQYAGYVVFITKLVDLTCSSGHHLGQSRTQT